MTRFQTYSFLPLPPSHCNSLRAKTLSYAIASLPSLQPIQHFREAFYVASASCA